MDSIRTISDIAKIAGVSKSTVSRALNNNPVISKKTRKRIQSIAEEHGFETHKGARCLSINSSQTIALIFPESEHHRHMVSDPFFVEVLKGITSTVREYDFDLIIGQPRKDVFKDLRRYIESKRADGIIYLGCCQNSVLGEHFEPGLPLISCGLETSENICSVDCDNLGGGRMAAEHLLQCGCKNIVFMGGLQGRQETRLRFQGFNEVLKKAGIEILPGNIVFGDYLGTSGYNLIKQHLNQPSEIDGLFACSDLMAIGALEAIRESGQLAGKQISVVGFDDIPFAQFSSPPLTTIRQNIFQIGEVLVHKLMQYIKDGVINQSILPVEMVVRKSTVIKGNNF